MKEEAKELDSIEEDLKGVDCVIHLAGLSNDPLGELSPNLTEDINYTGTIRLAEMSRKAGVSRFVYASSQSMYGISDTSHELDEDNSEKNPVTAYAATKWEAEVSLKKLNSNYDLFKISQIMMKELNSLRFRMVIVILMAHLN